MIVGEVKLIAAGYGAMEGPGMTLLSDNRIVDETLENVLLGYSCYPASLPKIRQCLETSGRYDCWVQAGWIYSQYHQIKEALLAIGIRMHITSIPEWDDWALKNQRIVIETVI